MGVLQAGGVSSPTVLCFANLWDEPETNALMELAIRAGATIVLPSMVDGSAVPELRRVLAEGPSAGSPSAGPAINCGIDPATWARDAMGVPAPAGPTVAPSDVGIAFVPGRAFDRHGTRLGRGGGHLDRLLAGLPPSCLRVGVGFDTQLVASIPREEHDFTVHAVITPTRWIDTGVARLA